LEAPKQDHFICASVQHTLRLGFYAMFEQVEHRLLNRLL
jgi:hypothetical protein